MKKRLSLIISALGLLICAFISVNAYASEPINIGDAKVELEYLTTVYDAAEKKPTEYVVINKDGVDKVLKKDVDYNIAYKNNVNVGTATATITGIGNYTGTISQTFKITPFDISQTGVLSVTLNYTTVVYNGELKTPTPTVKWVNNGKKVIISANNDYTVTYGNNRKIGTARVNIKGKGNFKGTYTRYFKILPATVSRLKASSSGNSITLKWNSVPCATGYQIYVYDASTKQYKYVTKVVGETNTTKKLTGLIYSKAYLYKVRAYTYVKSFDRNYLGSFSTPVRYCTRPNKVTLKSVTKSGTSIIVKWNKTKCSGYELWYSADSSFKKGVKKIVFTNSSKVSTKITNVNKTRKYFVKVRAYYTYNNVKYYGSFSNYLSTYYSNLYASYSTNYVYNPDRTTNLKIASKAISGTIIQPGETFSFNKVVGPRTESRGYKEAHVFSGDGIVNGVGGGICQVASTMFNCALKANVRIVERHQHNQRVEYVPLGRDAAIYGSAEDFKWKNTTKYPIRIVMTVKDGTITCKFYTCKDVKPPKTTIKVTQNGKKFYMKRIVNGKVNYSCYSNY